ncbi:hypothetical protein GGI43DRAFT_388246 [Trichoderma evansii]
MAEFVETPSPFAVLEIEDLLDVEISSHLKEVTSQKLVEAETLVSKQFLDEEPDIQEVIDAEQSPDVEWSAEYQEPLTIQERFDLCTWHAVVSHVPSYYICPAYKILLGDEEYFLKTCTATPLSFPFTLLDVLSSTTSTSLDFSPAPLQPRPAARKSGQSTSFSWTNLAISPNFMSAQRQSDKYPRWCSGQSQVLRSSSHHTSLRWAYILSRLHHCPSWLALLGANPSCHSCPLGLSSASSFCIVFPSKLVEVLLSTSPPSLDFFRSLTTEPSRDKIWAVYAPIMEKPGNKPKLYIGFDTNSPYDVRSRLRNYV